MAQLLQPGDKFHFAILLYPNITQLDFTAPFEFFAKVPGVDIRLFWKNHQPIVSAGDYNSRRRRRSINWTPLTCGCARWSRAS